MADGVRTQHGYHLDEVVSALQKEIRRGQEVEAMTWALEMIPQFEVYLWKRLVVIANEDIGIANPMILVVVPTLAETYMAFREDGKSGSARLALANAVLLMSRSAKTRIADHFQCSVFQHILQDGMSLQIPDYAKDKHTAAGRHLGRGLTHWLTEGAKLENEASVQDLYGPDAAEMWRHAKKDDWPKLRRRKEGGIELQQGSLFED